MIEQIVFNIFSILLIVSAVMVITVRNPVFAALFLVLSFFSSAAIWLVMHAEFLAIALVLVYVGAVMVLFLFVVMMLDINIARMREGFARYLPVALVVAGLMIIAMGLAVTSPFFNVSSKSVPVTLTPSNTTLLGQTLFTEYLYPFEIAGAILLVAIIAAIALTMRKPRSNKGQVPGKQVQVRKQDRLKIINVQSEQQ